MDRRKFLGSLVASSASIGMLSACHNESHGQNEALSDTPIYPLHALSREKIKIIDIRLTPLSYVHQEGPLWGVNEYIVWKADAGLIEVFTDQGIIGIGEGSPYSEPDKIKKYIEERVKPFLIGKNPFDVDFLTGGGPDRDYLSRAAWAGVNNACWDIIGKTKEMPVYRLLATNHEPKASVPIYASGGVEHKWYENGTEYLIEEALKYKEQGYTAFKFRNGTNWEYSGMTLEKYLPVLRKLREAVGPDFKLMIEKHSHDFEDIVNILCPALEDLKFYWYEEPINQWKEDAVEKHLQIKEAMPSVMVSGGERFTHSLQLHEWIITGAYDIIQSDCNFTGISEGWHIAQVAHLYGRLQCPHNWHGGLTTMANLHFVAGVPNGHMCELNQTYNPLKEELFKRPLIVKDGYMELPDKPGFGVEIIDDVAKKFPYVSGSYLKPNPVIQKKI
ncbi:L-alanine-DL-glutamate epimerase-like enolase superfamily enzyme [Catalinimonas alkaloidigena]|uniref:mandelate racemase/muconate lactonizing enzyme family protein n=1 Tax=Catalinimonas alkaloidigena TaxID=1075417 RepID=UPI002405B64B|nr:mandelate racemase/muconate lactonizing enzyme family protein [Catalinimonas alkaloidigena]MDF9796346.1 L-alanine-DL-glutamate epimerase-like enolase superfamily enzyme [Catalinimonas alkaloidigena]